MLQTTSLPPKRQGLMGEIPLGWLRAQCPHLNSSRPTCSSSSSTTSSKVACSPMGLHTVHLCLGPWSTPQGVCGPAIDPIHPSLPPLLSLDLCYAAKAWQQSVRCCMQDVRGPLHARHASIPWASSPLPARPWRSADALPPARDAAARHGAASAHDAYDAW